MREYKEIREIMQTEDCEFEAVQRDVMRCLDDSFAAHACGEGLRRWEKLYGIVPKAGDCESERRFAVLARLSESLPYTVNALNRALSVLCSDGYSLCMEGYTVTVRMSLQVQDALASVEQLLRRYVPANMVIDLDLVYNRHSLFSQYKYSQLCSYTHRDLRRGIF